MGEATNIGVIRVLIAEDHPMMVQSIIGILALDPKFEVVGAVTDGDQIVSKYQELRPNVVLCDQRMPRVSGVEALKRLVETDPTARVLMFSDVDDAKVVSAAMAAGATGYVLKRNMRPENLGDAIRRAAEGVHVLDESTTKIVMSELRSPSWPQGTLTAREIEVITAVSEGMSNKDVAAKLHLSDATVKTYLDRVYSKLSVNDRAAAVRKAIEAGLIA